MPEAHLTTKEETYFFIQRKRGQLNSIYSLREPISHSWFWNSCIWEWIPSTISGMDYLYRREIWNTNQLREGCSDWLYSECLKLVLLVTEDVFIFNYWENKIAERLQIALLSCNWESRQVRVRITALAVLQRWRLVLYRYRTNEN